MSRLYVNGAVDIETDIEDKSVNAEASPLWIGELNEGRGWIWVGLMDEVAIWNRALSDAEIGSLVGGTPVEPQSKLAATWGEIKTKSLRQELTGKSKSRRIWVSR